MKDNGKGKEEFFNSIYHNSLKFKNQEIEVMYMEERSTFDAYKKIAILSTYSACFFIMLRLIYLFCAYSFVENKLQKNLIPYLIGFIIGTIGMILDGLVNKLKALQILKGVFFCAPLCILGSYMSYTENIVTLNASPYFSTLYFVFILILVTHAFILCHNWISGVILLLIMFISNLVYIILFPWLIVDKIFFVFEFSLAFLSICTALRFYESSRRMNFFQTNQIRIQKEYTNAILNNIPESIVASENGKITYVNEPFKQLSIDSEPLINTNRELIDNSISDPNRNNERIATFNASALKFYKNKTQETLQDFISSSKEIGNEKDFSFQQSIHSKPVPYQINSANIQFNSSNIFVFTIRNMESYNELIEIKARQKYSKMFIASISHEFRTYLNIIGGNTELISGPLSEKEFQNSLRNIKEASYFLEILTQDLIDFNLLKEKKFVLSFNQFSIKDNLNEIMSLFVRKFNDKNISFELNIDDRVPNLITSDKMRITQIITNILSNSWKFTLKGIVSVIVSYTLEQKIVYVRVKDTGIGIKEEDITKIMKPFSKLEDPNNLNSNGIGIGLNICKKIAKRLGGSLRIKSEFNLGTEVILDFKDFANDNINDKLNQFNKNREIYKPDSIFNEGYKRLKTVKSNVNENNSNSFLIGKTEDSKEINQFKYNCKCQKILIVDDDFNNRFVLTNFCKRQSINCDEAINGEEAYAKVRAYFEMNSCCKIYKLILMDSNMPIMNGEEASIQIRKFLSIRTDSFSKILCVTANATNFKDYLLSFETKIYDDVLYKPLRYDKFQEIVDKYLAS